MRLRILLVLVALVLIVPGVAKAEYFLFYNGDIPAGSSTTTSQAQQRYTKLMYWVVASKCVSMWYVNDNSIVVYDKTTDCQSSLQDNRDSTQSAWTYCKNESASTINAQCYTCINTPGSCP
jgi:hypothetical protein